MKGIKAADKLQSHAVKVIADRDHESWLWMQTEEYDNCCFDVGLDPGVFRRMVRHARDIAREPAKLRRVK